jgi:hypothetical protein
MMVFCRATKGSEIQLRKRDAFFYRVAKDFNSQQMKFSMQHDVTNFHYFLSAGFALVVVVVIKSPILQI